MFTCFNVSCFVHDMSNVCPFTHAQKKKMHTHSNFAVIVVLVTLPAGGSQYNFSINRLAEDFFYTDLKEVLRSRQDPQFTKGSAGASFVLVDFPKRFLTSFALLTSCLHFLSVTSWQQRQARQLEFNHFVIFSRSAPKVS